MANSLKYDKCRCAHAHCSAGTVHAGVHLVSGRSHMIRESACWRGAGFGSVGQRVRGSIVLPWRLMCIASEEGSLRLCSPRLQPSLSRPSHSLFFYSLRPRPTASDVINAGPGRLSL